MKRYKEMLQLHPIPRKQYNDMISFIFNSESEPMLKGDSLLWINSPDEAVCVSAPLSDFMVWLIHTKPVKWLVVSLSHGWLKFSLYSTACYRSYSARQDLALDAT